ncbi:ROK family transcriptional regulator [Arthrobacter sp. 35W]|uniref:ROK family transcriptional regulator n=1 Tax=Arthrobacter sp. 35W TaxID=1132441 RepID=UPI0006869A91|nr:ROK family transcriptional regulator [Arthrobacter sp. 35W]
MATLSTPTAPDAVVPRGLPESALELARTVLIHGPLSRSELAGRVGLSTASLTRLSKPLLDAGVLVEGELVADGSVGRPVRLLDVHASVQNFVGIKVTGSAVLGALTDLRARDLATDELAFSGDSVEAVVDAIAELVERLRGNGSGVLTAVGISIGGNVDAHGVVLRAPFLGWRHVPLRRLLEERLGLPVAVENDVIALAAAEQWFGAGRTAANFAVLTIGAGVGYGIAINNRVVRTRDAGLGLGGHYPLDPNGPLCKEGHRGCSTGMLTIPSICAQVSAALGRPVDYEEVLALAADGNPVAAAVVDSAARALGRMIAAAANLAMVNTVVLAGEGIGMFAQVESIVQAALAADRDPEADPVELVVTPAAFDEWARGAAAIAIQQQAFAG